MQRDQALVLLVQDLASCGTAQEVFDVLARATRHLLSADGATVVMREGDQCHYLEESAIGALWKGQRFPMEHCISGWAILHDEQVAISNIDDDDRIPHSVYADTFVRSLVMTPIRRDQGVIGSLGAYWAQPRQAGTAELTLLAAIADCAALALRNVQLQAQLRDDVRRKQQFLSSLAHKLGETLGPLRTSLHQQRAAPEAAAQQRAQEIIARQLARQGELIAQLIESSDLLGGQVDVEFRPVDVAAVVAQAVEAKQAAAQAAQLTLEYAPPAMPVWVSGDARRLGLAVGQGLDNSLRCTPPGGAIVVSIERSNGVVLVRVADSGIGISPEVLPELFEPFFRPTEEPAQSLAGLGLGLSMVSRIARLHGGEASIASEGPGRGACLTMRLPALAARQGQYEPSPPPVAQCR